MSKERPILFSGPMVRAILDGRKAVTRRPVKPQPAGEWAAPGRTACPYGQPGDVLWVRETWRPWRGPNGLRIQYRAGGHLDLDEPVTAETVPADRWRPSIFMPRRACRLLLRVTDVRVERLHDITPEEIRAEGLTTTLREHDACVDLREQWVTGWDGMYSENDALRWDANPWVWRVAFEREGT